jgi:hypothetical protein
MSDRKETTFLLYKAATNRGADRHVAIARVVHFLEELPEDRSFKVLVTEVKSTRSLAQNAYLWGVVYERIKQHLEGWDAQDIHEFCLGECFGWETVEGFGRRRLRPVRRSSKLSVTEFMAFVEFIQRTMAERGIDIPNPNEGDPW